MFQYMDKFAHCYVQNVDIKGNTCFIVKHFNIEETTYSRNAAGEV